MHGQHEIIPKHEARNSRNYSQENRVKCVLKIQPAEASETTGQKTGKSQLCAV